MSVLTAQDPIYRSQALRKAEPLAEHVIASLAFLRRVTGVQLTGGDKKTFQFLVLLRADPEDAESKDASFTITRSADDVDKLQKLAMDACCRHIELRVATYGIKPCALCEPFKSLPQLPVRSRDRLVTSKEEIQRTIEARVVSLVDGAIVPPTNPQLFCEGVTRLPAAVTKFLLQGVDQTRL